MGSQTARYGWDIEEEIRSGGQHGSGQHMEPSFEDPAFFVILTHKR